MNFNKCLKTQLYKMLISPVPVICAIMIVARHAKSEKRKNAE